MTSHKDFTIIKKFDSADKEEFKRPDHTDFMTSAELKKAKFSGIRRNELAFLQELWVDGEIKLSIAYEDVDSLWDSAYAEVFGLHHVQTLNSN